MKLRLLAAATAVLVLGSGATLAQTAPAARPATPAPRPAAAAAAPVATDRTTLGYSIGYETAKDLVDHNIDVDQQALIRGINDALAKRPSTVSDDKRQAVLNDYQRKMFEQEKAQFEKLARENKARSDAFMAANKAKPGVVSLPSGVQYRIIEPATGAKPVDTSTVTMHFRGTISTGQPFADTQQQGNQQPTTIKVSDLPMKGLKEAIKLMPEGSRWEIYLPADLAYGNDPRAMIGPSQAVIMDIRLLKVAQ